MVFSLQINCISRIKLFDTQTAYYQIGGDKWLIISLKSVYCIILIILDTFKSILTLLVAFSSCLEKSNFIRSSKWKIKCGLVRKFVAALPVQRSLFVLVHSVWTLQCGWEYNDWEVTEFCHVWLEWNCKSKQRKWCCKLGLNGHGQIIKIVGT